MDCLVTKLNGNVSDDSLLKLGEFRIKVNRVKSPTNKTQSIFLLTDKDITIEIVGEGYFTDNTLLANNGKRLSISANSETSVYFSNGDFYISIPNKYALKKVNSTTNSTSSDSSNKFFSIDDLKYSDIVSYNINSNQVTGDLSSVKNWKNVEFLILNTTQVTGDIANIKNLTKLKSIYLGETKLTGDVSAFSNLVNLDTINAVYSNISGDISALSSLSAEKLKGITISTSLDLSSPLTHGDIASFKNLLALRTINIDGLSGDVGSLETLPELDYLSLKNGSSLTGDLAKLADTCRFLSAVNSDCNFTWATTRPSSAKILAIEGKPKIDNIDKMLQNQAQCQKGFIDSEQIWFKMITATGTRTSASDGAISTLQEKGYTISVPVATDTSSVSLISTMANNNFAIAYKDKELIVGPVDLTEMQIYPASDVTVKKFDTKENAEKFISSAGLVKSESE